jgi:hypothetical protein
VLEISAVESSKPIAVRMHLTNSGTGKAVKVPGVPMLGDHFVFYDKVELKLPLGAYQFVMERGPEYLVRKGHFKLENYANDRKTVDLRRFVNMADEGWYAGDLDVWRTDREIELAMEAEDLYVASLVTFTNGRNAWGSSGPPLQPVLSFDGKRFCSLTGGEDWRGGSAIGLLNLPRPIELPSASAAIFPSPVTIAATARRASGWVDAERAFSWDLPLLVAAEKLDSVQVANRHLQRERVFANESGGRTRDPAMYPGANGFGRWSLDIYYHLLNCGLRIPPTAGSGSGWMPTTSAKPGTAAAMKAAASGNFNPVGYNRVYVHVDGGLTWEKWWDGLRAGRVVVTNGPIIRPTVEGEPPGYVFKAPAGETVELEIGLSLSMRDDDRVTYLEIVKDGRVEHDVRLDKWKETGGKLPPVKFEKSGWFLVRAVTDQTKTYRYAMTAPYYVEIGEAPRISRASAQFFVDWCGERQKMLADKADRSVKFADEREREEVLGYWRRAEEYWNGVVGRANAE